MKIVSRSAPLFLLSTALSSLLSSGCPNPLLSGGDTPTSMDGPPSQNTQMGDMRSGNSTDGPPASGGKMDGGMSGADMSAGGQQGGGASDSWLPDGVYVDEPLAGRVLLGHTRVQLLGRELTDWRVDAWLNDPPKVPVSVSSIGECRALRPGSGTGRGLDAGDMTLGGAPYGPRVISLDPVQRTYAVVESDNDVTDGALFTEASTLSLTAAGGQDIQQITPLSPWHGVTQLDFRAPLTLASLPAADLQLSWVAAPRADTIMEVSLRSKSLRIDCPVPDDHGSYTVSKAVIDALPAGPVYLFIHRLTTARATTTPDHGPVLLESRSRFQIITHK